MLLDSSLLEKLRVTLLGELVILCVGNGGGHDSENDVALE
jgi:hypothetical protein